MMLRKVTTPKIGYVLDALICSKIRMNLLKFISPYKDEKSCRDKFKTIRDKAGVVCEKCGSSDHYWLKS